MKRWAATLTSVALVGGLGLSGAAPAHANDGEHRSHALAELLDVDALGLDALEAFTAEQNYTDDAGSDPDTGVIDASAVEQLLNVQLGGVSVPIDLGAQVGAASSYASTPAPNEATAASGLITSNGAIDVNGGEPYGYATVDLTNTLSQLGVSTDGVVDQLSLDLGALASTAQSVDGEVASSDYMIAGGRFTLDSPLVAGLSGTLNTAVSDINTDVNTLLGSDGAVQTVLDGISTEPIAVDLGLGLVEGLSVDLGSPTLNASVDLAGVVDGVLGEPIVSESGAVTLDPSTGQVIIDVAQLHGGDLNGLPANTELLTAAQTEQITTEVNALVGELTNEVSAAVTTAVQGTAVTLTLDPEVSAAGGAVSGDVSITIDTTLAELMGGGEGIAEDDISIEGSLTVELPLLPDVSIPLGDLVGELVEPILSQLLPSVAGPLTTAVEEGLGDIVEPTLNTALGGVLDGLTPVFDVLNQVVSLTANAQESPGDLGATSFTVRALDVTVLPSVNAAALPLASSSLYSEAVPEINPDLTVDPNEVAPGESTTVEGTGYTPDSTVTVTITDEDGNVVDTITDVPTDTDGNFPHEWTVPEGTDPGELTVVGTDDTTDEIAEAVLTVTEDDSDEDADADADVNGTDETDADADVDGTDETDADADVDGTDETDADAAVEGTEATDADANVDASASASASADADSDANAAAEAAAQEAADADANDAADADASAAADVSADPAAAAAAQTSADEDASTTASADADSASEAAAQAAAHTEGDDDSAASASAETDADATAAAAAEAAANEDASSEASADAAAEATGDPDGTEDDDADADVDGTDETDAAAAVEGTEATDADANVDASASASASADADASADPAAQAAAQAAADADADDATDADASAAADVSADAAAEAAAAAAADEDASTTASADADSASEAAAEAAAHTEGQDDSAADTTAAADADAAAAASAAANADASTDASAAAAADADAAAAADGEDADAEDPSVTVEPDSAQPEDGVAISGDDFVPGSTVTVIVTDADGNVIGTIDGVEVGADGSFTTDWTVPEGTDPGELTVTATDDSDESITASATLTVTDGAAPAGDVTDEDAADEDEGALAATGTGTVLLIGGLSALLLLLGLATLLIIRHRRMSTTE